MLPVVPLLPLSVRHPTRGPSHSDRTDDLDRSMDDGFGPPSPGVLRGLVDAAGLDTSYDPDDLLGRVTSHCARLVPGGSAGIVLVDSADQPKLAAVTATSSRSAALFDVVEQATPGMGATWTGRTFTVEDLTAGQPTGAAWCRRASAEGYRSAHAIPMRLRDRVIGALTILDTRLGPLPAADLGAARAFADIATITLLTRDQADRSAVLTAQLQLALDTRVVIEQAKGVIAGALNLTVGEAFDVLRHNCRQTNTRMADLAGAISTGRITVGDLVRPAHLGRQRTA